MENALKKAIKIIGGPGAVGRLVGVTSQAVSQWQLCPAMRVLAIEEACDSEVTRYELRPDVFGPAPGIDAVMRSSSSVSAG